MALRTYKIFITKLFLYNKSPTKFFITFFSLMNLAVYSSATFLPNRYLNILKIWSFSSSLVSLCIFALVILRISPFTILSILSLMLFALSNGVLNLADMNWDDLLGTEPDLLNSSWLVSSIVSFYSPFLTGKWLPLGSKSARFFWKKKKEGIDSW